MRRADRLFQLVQPIRGRKLTTATCLGKRLAVTSRTIDRDVADLQHHGALIKGVAGAGHRLQALLEAIHAQRKVQVTYNDPQNKTSQRTLRPLGCFCLRKLWKLAARCESRSDLCSFRIDRIQSWDVLEAVYKQEASKTLADFLPSLGSAQTPS